MLFPGGCPPYCLREVLSVTWTAGTRLGWPGSELQGSSCLHLPSTGLHKEAATPSLSSCAPEMKLRPPYLTNRGLADLEPCGHPPASDIQPWLFFGKKG